MASYPEFPVLRAAGGEHLIRFGPGSRSPFPLSHPPCGRLRTWSRADTSSALVLRELARRRESVRVAMTDATRCDGTIEAVGSDYLEVAEHDLAEARGRVAVRARRFVEFAAVVAVTLPQPGR